MTSTQDAAAHQARELVREHGRTFAQEAGIRLQDTPAPLYQMLVLSTLLAARINAEIAVAAARELFAAGLRTPRKMSSATWQQKVDILGLAQYKRYDESTATALGRGAELVITRWGGDLRQLRDEADGDPKCIQSLLQEVPRIGPVGAAIFCREAQGVWPQLRPFFDERALAGAGKYQLPQDPEQLARLVEPGELAAFAAALVRSTL